MIHPLIYVNGCSYSDENYHPDMQGNTYGHYYGKIVNGYVINRAVKGSCNRRIIRTSAHDVIEQRRLNPTQPIIAMIQLTFEIRDELWIEDPLEVLDPVESNFRPQQFSKFPDWRQKLLNNRAIDNHSSFLKKWSEGRAFFYNAYAQRVNLALDVLMFTKLLNSLNIQYIIFQGPQLEKLETEYVKDFFLDSLPKNVMNFENFGFCNWCGNRGFTPLDPSEPKNIGHYDSDAHQAFAEEFLIKVL